MALTETGVCLDSFGDEGLRLLDGFAEGGSGGQKGGNGGGIGAAGAVGVGSIDAGGGEPVEGFLCDKNIAGLTDEMSPFD